MKLQKKYSVGIHIDEDQFHVTELMQHQKTVRATHSASGKNLKTLLPKRKISTLVTSVPDESTSKKMLSIEKRTKHNPLPSNTDCIVLNTKKHSLDILLITAKSNIIDHRIQALQQANINPTIITTDLYALMHYVKLHEKNIKNDTVIALAHVKSHSIDFAIVVKNTIIFLRNSTHQDNDSLQKAIQKSLDIFLLSSHYKQIDALYYCGSGHPINTFQNPQTTNIKSLPNISHVLAMKGLIKNKQGINFLPWRDTKKSRNRKKFYLTFSILSAIFIINVSHNHIKQQRETKQQKDTNQELMKKTQSLSIIQHQTEQIKEKQQVLKNKIDTLKQQSIAPIITTLFQLTNHIPATTTLDKISYENNTFTVSGFSRYHKDITQIEKIYPITHLQYDNKQRIHFILELSL